MSSLTGSAGAGMACTTRARKGIRQRRSVARTRLTCGMRSSSGCGYMSGCKASTGLLIVLAVTDGLVILPFLIMFWPLLIAVVLTAGGFLLCGWKSAARE